MFVVRKVYALVAPLLSIHPFIHSLHIYVGPGTWGAQNLGRLGTDSVGVSFHTPVLYSALAAVGWHNVVMVPLV